jgi:hypothetical protein
MTEAMLRNPQFQIFSIDEEESIRSSQRTSMRASVIHEERPTLDTIARINQLAEEMDLENE